MKQFEYRLFELQYQYSSSLNLSDKNAGIHELGKQGWELVTSVGEKNLTLLFKREI